MNKQELINKLKELLTESTNEYDCGHDYGIRRAIVFAEKLDEPERTPEPKPLEPEKPVVPQFVAEWYEKHKDNFEYSVQCLCVHGCLPVRKIQTWFDNEDNKPIETLVMMHKFGYVIEEGEKMNKPTVPQFVADWIEWCKKNNATLLGAISPIDELGTAICDDKKVESLDASRWATRNQETFAKAWLYGYEIEKEKLYRAKNRHTGEYLCYCFEFYHDKNSSSENQRFTAEEKRWKELGYWGNDLYIFEEAGGEDE